MNARLYKKYVEEVKPELVKTKGYKNVHEVPALEKIIVHMGVSASLEKSAVDDAAHDLKLITGRKPATNFAKKSVANFKLRQGQAIGCRVTLRGQTMYEFFDRLISAALPSVRDFRGISAKAFDGRGNYSLGISDQTIFPEIELDKVKRTQGMDITIVTSAKTDDDAHDFLKLMGVPFVDKKQQ
jgi:large subunit ribosomal protein L5